MSPWEWIAAGFFDQTRSLSDVPSSARRSLPWRENPQDAPVRGYRGEVNEVG